MELSGEKVVSIGVSAGVLVPKLMANDGVDAKRDTKGVEGDNGLTEIDLPWHKTFAEGKGEFGTVALETRHEAHEEVGLPSAIFTIVPTQTYGHHADASSILNFGIVGNEGIVVVDVFFHSDVVDSLTLIGI